MKQATFSHLYAYVERVDQSIIVHLEEMQDQQAANVPSLQRSRP